MSNRRAPINSSSADCPVLTDCSLVFAFSSFEGFVLGSLGEILQFSLVTVAFAYFEVFHVLLLYQSELLCLCAVTLLMKFMMIYVWRKFSSVTR